MLVVQRRHRLGGNWTATLDSATITAGLALALLGVRDPASRRAA
jgi:hypothetical protein